MTPQATLADWLGRLGALAGEPLLVTADTLDAWPEALVDALKAQGMLVKAMPASSVVCPGCERACVMPVEVPVDAQGVAWPFVMCDKRSDVARVPVTLAALESWKSSFELVARGLADMLDAPVASPVGTMGTAWTVGSVKGEYARGQVSLHFDAIPELEVSQQRVPLAEVLTLQGTALALNLATLQKMADRLLGKGPETPEQRRRRLMTRVAAVKASGNRAFLKVVSAEEGISGARLKQILGGAPEPKTEADTLEAAWGISQVSKKRRPSPKTGKT